MRTTLTIDDDLAGILRRRARELDKSFKELVNSALRKGLAEEIEAKSHPIAVRPHDFGSSREFDFEPSGKTIDELEVESYLRKAAKDAAP